MFRASFPNARYIVDLLKAIYAVADEGSFKITGEGMRFVAMDPAHISLVDFELSRMAAEEYECDEETEMTVNLGQLLRLLRSARDQQITLSYNPEAKQLEVILVSPSRESRLSLSTLEPIESNPTIPRLSFEACARISSKAMKEAISDCFKVSDYVKVSISPEDLILAAGSELGKVEIRFPRHGNAIYDIDAEKEARACFPLSYFEKIVKAGASVSDETVIELATNKPIKLGFPIPSGKLEYLIAPRIENP